MTTPEDNVTPVQENKPDHNGAERGELTDFTFLLSGWDENQNYKRPRGIYSIFCNRWVSLAGVSIH